MEFDIDPKVLIVTYPCFILTSGTVPGFICHEVAGGGKAVTILTDEDLLDRYRWELGLHDRPALQFDSPAELLRTLRKFPADITHVVVDPPQRFAESTRVRSFRMGGFRRRLARSLEESE